MLLVCGFGFLMFYENNYKLLNLFIFGSNIADRVPHFSVQVVFISSGFTKLFTQKTIRLAVTLTAFFLFSK